MSLHFWPALCLGLLCSNSCDFGGVARAQASGPVSIQGQIDAAAPGATIHIPAGTFLESLQIDKTLTLIGAGATNTIIDGSASGPTFLVGAGAVVRMQDLAAQGGKYLVDSAPVPILGMKNSGDLTMINCTIDARPSAAMFGHGGLYNEGTMLLSNCLITGKQDIRWGAVQNFGSLNVKACLFQNNRGGDGAAIYNTGPLTIEDSVFLSNDAQSYPGGAIRDVQFADPIAPIVIKGSVFAANRADVGGAIYSSAAPILVMGSVFTDNRDGFGAGAVRGSSVEADDTLFAYNESGMGAGGLFSSGSSRLSRCTFAYNISRGGVGGGMVGIGYLAVNNCTVSGNQATKPFSSSPGLGGGIYADSCDLVISNSTVVNNRGAGGSGGIHGVTVRLFNTIVAGNTAFETNPSDCAGQVYSLGYNLIGNPAGCNYVGETAKDIFGQNPLLGPLQDNGGATWTHALTPASPAIDRGAVVNGTPTDQRGLARPVDGNGDGSVISDIGAFELDGSNAARIRQIQMIAGPRVRLLIQGLPGKSYAIEATTDLGTVSWSLQGAATPLGGNLHEWIGPVLSVPTRQFFRAVEL